MKHINELKLTRHDKAWMKIGPKYHQWTFDEVHKNLERKHGVKIDSKSLRAYLKDNSLYPFIAKGNAGVAEGVMLLFANRLKSSSNGTRRRQTSAEILMLRTKKMPARK